MMTKPKLPFNSILGLRRGDELEIATKKLKSKTRIEHPDILTCLTVPISVTNIPSFSPMSQ